ncbi:cadherin EGF LAG seven-pass G-type receptor 2-like [Diadema setosum]|uniref:cadherin EGF LAG seven-pass G-type receptor 2-like n=1 Tax=Diadema setosum TaxID=31175 RepID=UPI003B3A2AEB
MMLRGAMASLLRILWVAAVFHSSALAAFNVHVSTFLEPDISIFNISLSGEWTYVLHPTLTGEDAKERVQIDRSTGEVSLSEELDCSLLRENPFTLYVQARTSRTRSDQTEIKNGLSSSTLVPIAIHVHGNGCHPRKARKKDFDSQHGHTPLTATQPQQILVEYPEGTCWFIGDILLQLRSFLPSSLAGCPVVYDLLDTNTNQLGVDPKSGILTMEQDILCVLQHQPENVLGSMHIPESCLSRGQFYRSGDEEDEVIPISIELQAADQDQRSDQSRGDKSGHGKVILNRFRRQVRNTFPSFSSTVYTQRVPENEDPGYMVITITATDNDDGDNGRLTYSMTAQSDARSGAMFDINPDTGLIVTTMALDRETIESHTFRLTATDGGTPPKSATTYLTIYVDDRNDHTPIFEQPSYVITTSESQNPGTLITRVQASDGDIGDNANIRYSIVNSQSPNDVFTINPSSGEIKTRERLDRERIERYNLIVMAQDMGTNPMRRNSTAEVSLTVLDVNDNSPQFSQASYEVSVREDVGPHDPGSQILHVIATDADIGANAEVHYSLTYGNFEGRFRIDSNNGYLSLQNALDFETARSYRLTIRAQDSGNPPRENTTTVTVTVIDVNDNGPQFTQNVYQGIVREDVGVDYSILSVNARDDDEGDNARITFSIPNPPNNFPFDIGPTSGAITTIVNLDRELNHQWEFNVLAVDGGEIPKSATASVMITVTDVNDNPPTFPQEKYTGSVREDVFSGYEVLTVVATDPDEQNTISYRIADSEDPNRRTPFGIRSQNNEGAIQVTSQLNYNTKSFYSLTVTASDGQYDSTCLVLVNVTDVNNYAPVFQNSPYNVYVSESVSIGHVVVQVSASDNDAGSNAEISYSMDNVPEFEINAESGEIRTRVELDREATSHYTLYVTASDHGDIPQQSRAFVQITIQDINDNAPVFATAKYEADIQENSAPLTSITTISASDADQGMNSAVKYTFEGGNDGGGRFTIDETSGVIRVASMLDRESRAEYHLVAYAYDQGVPSLSTSVMVDVEITDTNDNPPSFSEREYFVTIRENRIPGEQVMKLTATDPDSGFNSLIQYTIVRGDQDFFEINPDSGLITSLEMFDYEARNQYEVVVHATNVPFFAEATVYIRVTDVNDNAPILGDFEIFFNNYEGYFLEGDIGRVPATDPDESDTLEYEIINGNDQDHLLLNTTTGGIRLNPSLRVSDIPQTIQFTVKVTDGLNPATATCKFRMIMVTHDMLFSSVTVQVENMQSNEFLSPKLVQFIEALAAIIPANQDLVYLFSIKDEDTAILNITFAAQRPDGSFFSSQYLQERVYLKRSQLSQALGATVLPFGDNLCLNEVCSDFYHCIAPLTFWTPGGFIATTSVIFRSIHPETIYKCDCPPGFTGNYCMTEINFCYSNPCANGGVCVQKEAGYTCLCQEGFIGTNCEMDKGKGRCSGATDAICKHGGTCRNYLNGGFECNCADPEVHGGPFCEMRTRNFPRNSFMMFWSLSQRVRLQLSVSFATQEPNGLIFYNGRYNQQHDFIALEITDGQVRFSFSTGSTVTMVTASRVGGVNDGEWHTAHIEYYLSTATIILDDCDPAVALRYSNKYDDSSCAASATYYGELRFLDLTGPFILGGLPDLPSEFPVENTDFIGCIRDVYIDNELLDLATNVEDVGTQPGCPHKGDFCESDPCHTGATCESGWDRYTCHCSPRSGGVNCQESLSDPVRFLGQESYMTFDLDNTVSLPWTNRIVFRTRDTDGVLMFVELSNNINIRIELVDGYIHYVTSSVSVQLDQRPVNDGEWHDFLVEWKNNQMVLSVDFNRYTTSARATDSVSGKVVLRVTLGGRLIGNTLTSGFLGCLKGMSIGGSPLDPAVGARTNVEDGCNAPDSCQDADCPTHSQCVDLWDLHECQCDKGYYGPSCSSACDLNVCRHGSRCTLSRGAEHGYHCTCSELYYGDHCQYLVEECPDDWWGYQICGPCECDEEMGFESACNKTTSECYCQEHSYRPSDSDTCFTCDCYEVGSSSQDCEQQTGQCSCKRGVIGRRCDACVDPHAEVTLRGCEVVYDSCPKRFAASLWWPRTKFGKTAVLDCPSGSYGIATRSCDFEDNWQTPNLFNCTSDSFASLQNTLNDLKNGMKLYPEVSFAIAEDLQQATNETDDFHGNDINIAYQVLCYILEHESKQVGLNVTATIRRSFTKNIIETASRLFEPRNKAHWDMIQETSLGTAELMEDLEAFALNIARFTTSFSYAPEFSVISPNIVMHFGIIVRENFTTKAIPIHEVESPILLEDTSQVHIPGDLIKPRPEPEGYDPNDPIYGNVAVSAFLLYSTLQNLLPNSTADDVRHPDNKVGQLINSPIISFSIFDSLANGTLPNPLLSPVVLEFQSLDAVNRSGPQCVYWDFALYNDTGGWSTEGCRLTGYNRTHINCSCSHLTNIAVIMDNAPYQWTEDITISLSIAVYVGVAIAIICLLITFLTLLGISNLHTNLNSIHVNLCFVLIVAEVTFGVGINTDNTFACTAVAIILHYVLLSAFGWMFVEGVHLYRMMTEIRDINSGPMTYSYVISYGVSALIVGMAVPLSNINYGTQVNSNNEHFCWFSVEDLLIWSFAGPVLAVVAMNMVVIFLAIVESCKSGQKTPEFGKLRSGIRSAGILLPLLGITWVFGLLAVNQTVIIYQYLFAIFNGLTGLAILLFHCVLDYRVRREWCICCARMQGKQYKPGDMNTSTNSRSALTYSKNDQYGTPNRYNIGISTGSIGASSRSSKMSQVPSYRPEGYLRKTASTTTTSPSAHFDYKPQYYRNNAETNLDAPHMGMMGHTNPVNVLDQDSDSDSDVSLQRQRDSMSLASSHSSDEEEAAPVSKDMLKTTPKKVNLPDTVPQTILPVHSTPKAKPSPDMHKKIWSGDVLTSDNETKHRAELKILDPKFPPPESEKEGSQHSGSVSGSRTHLPAVSQRPDILPLKGIMKTPGSSHKGSPLASGSSHGSLSKIPTDPIKEKLTIVHPSGQQDNDSDGGSSNETSV